MRLSTLNDALPIVAAAYGRKFGVKVRVGGQNAFTDGQSINIPSLSEEVRSRTLAYGYLAHEAGHVRFTDFTQARHPQPLGKLLEGVIEDIRIEAAMITTYPGTRKTLDAVLEHLIEAGRMQPPSDQDPPGQVLGNAVLLIGRYHYRRQSALQMHSQQSEEVLSQVFGQQFVRQLHGLLAEIPGLTCTAETMALAQRIISLLESLLQGQSPEQANAADQPDNQPAGDHTADDQASGKDNSAQDDSYQEGQQASGEDCAGASADDGADAKASAATDADSGDEDHHKQSADSTSQQGSTSEQGSSSGPDSSLAAQAAQAALQADKDALPEDLFEAVGNILQSHSSDDTQLLPTAQSYQGDAELGKEALERVKVHSAHLNAQLQGLVQSQRLTRSRTARSGRRLSAKHLHRAGVADSRIFRASRAQPAPNTALHLLIDLSLSMQGGPDRLALDAAMSLALALESINGVSRAVSVFPGLRGQSSYVTQVLAHDDRVSTRTGAFVQKARGSTPMTGALWFAAADLLARSEPRKVVLVLTDGEPNDTDSTLSMISRAQSAQLEMIGIGIQHRVDHLFPQAIRIDQLSELKNSLFDVTGQLLLSH